MALCHRTLPVYGVQFHPESVATLHGKRLLAELSFPGRNRLSSASPVQLSNSLTYNILARQLVAPGPHGTTFDSGPPALLASVMRVLGVIPARLGSTRLPNKPLQPLAGEPLITRVVRACAGAWPDRTAGGGNRFSPCSAGGRARWRSGGANRRLAPDRHRPRGRGRRPLASSPASIPS